LTFDELREHTSDIKDPRVLQRAKWIGEPADPGEKG